jgi:hypothetical protein
MSEIGNSGLDLKKNVAARRWSDFTLLEVLFAVNSDFGRPCPIAANSACIRLKHVAAVPVRYWQTIY